MNHGATLQEIEAEIAKCGRGRPKQGNREALEAMQAAQVALFENNDMLDADAFLLERFLALPLATALIFRIIARIPVVGSALSVGITIIRSQATDRIGKIAVQRAANDVAIRRLAQAAANEAQFLRTGTGL